MERQTKHRILGVLVLVGLVIILLPFFQSGTESADATSVEAPPFPDQAAQMSTNTSAPVQATETAPPSVSSSDQSAVTPPSADTGAAASSAQPETPAAPTTAEDQNANKNGLDQPDEAINLNQPANVVNAKEPVIEPSTAPKQTMGKPSSSNESDDAPTGLDPNPEPKKRVAAVSHHAAKHKTVAIKKTSVKAASLKTEANRLRAGEVVSYSSLIGTSESKPVASMNGQNELVKLTNVAWVIQVGTFKSKTNALRLVNTLRDKGYKSFIQQAQLSSGATTTRVYVGPENKQTAARSLAGKIKSEFNLQGVVVNYKPLAM